MTPVQTMERYRHMVVVNGERLTHELSFAMRQLSEEAQSRLMARSNKAGAMWLFRDPAKPGYLLEVVYSLEHGDYVSSVYRDDAVNSSAGDVLRMRENLIDALAERHGLSAELMTVTDEGRGREIGLNEMGTGQLIDLLSEQLGSSLAVADNVAGNLSLMDRVLAGIKGFRSK